MITASQLDTAIATHTPIPGPHGRVFSLSDAYAVQREFVAALSARTGSPLAGYKVAFTSPEAAAAVDTDGYASGALLASQVLESGDSIGLSERFTPILEVEIIFRVLEAIGPCSLEQVAASTEVTAGIEVPESRFESWFGGAFPALKVSEVVSDNCLAGVIVRGSTWVPASSLDLSQVTATLSCDGKTVREGAASAVEPTPLHVIQWLAGQLAGRGERLEAGLVVSSGTLTATIVAKPGHYTATFSHGLGSVDLEVLA